MKIKIMTSEAIAYIKQNLNSLLPNYQSDENPEKWLKEKLGKPAFVEVDSLEFDDFELSISEDNPASLDVINIKLFYTHLKNINDSFATDERLWAGLSHTQFYDYLKRRWEKIDSDSILNHYFFKTENPRSYMINTLARLWWIGRKTYRENKENEFEILDYISHDINGYSFTLFGSNWTNSDKTLDMFFNAILKFEETKKIKVKRELFNDVIQFTNAMCGIYIIEACDSNFIENEIYEFVTKRYEERLILNEKNRINNVKKTGINKLDNLIKAINYIGGHGNTKQIIEAYEKIIDNRISFALKNYIKDNLEKNCPTSKKYDGKPMFYKISYKNSVIWKVANEYLTKSNNEIRNKLIEEQISELAYNEKIVFNIITAVKKDRFELNDLMIFDEQLKQLHKDIYFKNFIPEHLKRICEKGLVELLDNGIYKKTYKDIQA